MIAVDQITEDLRRSVEFLNHHSTDDVIFLALELGYFSRNGVEIITSETYGAEVETPGKGKGPSAAAKPRWTLEEISRAANEIPDPRSKELVDTLLHHAEDNAAVIKGGQGARVSAGFYYSVAAKRPSLWSLWLGDNPEISLNIASVANVSQDIAKQAFDTLLTSPSLVEIVGRDFDASRANTPASRYPRSQMTRRR